MIGTLTVLILATQVSYGNAMMAALVEVVHTLRQVVCVKG